MEHPEQTFHLQDLVDMPTIRREGPWDLKSETESQRVWLHQYYPDMEYQTYRDGEWSTLEYDDLSLI